MSRTGDHNPSNLPESHPDHETRHFPIGRTGRVTWTRLLLGWSCLGSALVSPAVAQTAATATNAPQRGTKTIIEVAKSNAEFTRKSEGDVIELKDGRLLLVYMEFSGDGSDFAKTRLVAQESADGGRTWGKHRVVTTTAPGDMNVYSPNLIRSRMARSCCCSCGSIDRGR